ncbi:hypothetical protein OFC63_29605, partial [Escherichia coli]|nr:hypothetical protein [Escherichia coli]
MSAPLQSPAAADAVEVAALRQRFREGKASLIQAFRDARPTAGAASRLLKGLARHVDGTLQRLWEAAYLPKGAALIAVG